MTITTEHQPDTPDEGSATEAATEGLSATERDVWMARWYIASRRTRDGWGRWRVVLRFRLFDGREMRTSGVTLEGAILTAMQVQRAGAGLCYAGGRGRCA
jgi:hypothetical protein